MKRFKDYIFLGNLTVKCKAVNFESVDSNSTPGAKALINLRAFYF